ncbi:MAG: HAD-IA family hydrolase [Nannocystales bacterium]
MPTDLPLTLDSGTALWVDAAGTLLHPARPVADVYAEHAGALGHRVESDEVASRLGPAMRTHRPLRSGDRTWRRYWDAVVSTSIGADDPACFEQLYAHYERPEAWRVEPDARECLGLLRARGVRLALISNWDDRLRSTLEGLGLVSVFDALLISGEEGVEKPDAEIFLRAAHRLRIAPERSLMVGDDPDTDAVGARSVGAFVIEFGSEINGFRDLLAAS